MFIRAAEQIHNRGGDIKLAADALNTGGLDDSGGVDEKRHTIGSGRVWVFPEAAHVVGDEYEDGFFEIWRGAGLFNKAADCPIGVPDGINLIVKRSRGRFGGYFTGRDFVVLVEGEREECGEKGLILAFLKFDVGLIVKIFVAIAELGFECAGSEIIFENHASVAVAAKKGLAMVVPRLATINEHCFVAAGFEDRAKSEKCAFRLRASGNAFSGQVRIA